MKKRQSLQKTSKIALAFLVLFSLVLTSASSFATNLPLISDEATEEVLISPKNEYLDPLGAAENNQKAKEQKERNNIITIICLVVMFLSGIGVALILFHPLFHHKKKKIVPKF